MRQEQEFFTNKDHLKIILYLFANQNKKETFAVNICKEVFNPQNYADITKTYEYKLTNILLTALEHRKIVKKVVPKDKDKFRTHFFINLPGFIDQIMFFLSELPTYMSPYEHNKELWLKELKYKNNKLIEDFVIMYYRALSLEPRVKEITGNLKDSIFILIDKVIPEYVETTFHRSSKNPFSDNENIPIKLSELVETTKDDEKKNFLLFLALLYNLSKDYLPYACVGGFSKDLYEYTNIAIGKQKKAWSNNLNAIINKEISAFEFLPTD